MTLPTIQNDRLADGGKINNLPDNTNQDISDLQAKDIAQDNAIALNTAKRSYPITDENRLADTSGTNTGDNATNSQYSGLATSKQDTLVSGTNIKTINGNTVLGSGDITITVIAPVDSVNGQIGVVVLDTDDISEGVNKYVTSAEKTKLSNLSGTNTGDQDISGIGVNSGKITAIETKTNNITVTQPVNLDTIESDTNTNNAKVGITPTQASDITTNNAKVSYTDATKVAGIETGATKDDTASIKSKLGITTLSGSNTGDQVGDGVTITGAGTLLDPFVSIGGGGGSGDVNGPVGAVDNNIVVFDSITGKIIKDGGNTITEVKNRANHTGTQAVGTITGLGTLATQNGTFSGTSSGTNTGDNATNTQYSGLVTNATHTGDVTGDTVLTIENNAVTNAKISGTGTRSASTYYNGAGNFTTPTDTTYTEIIEAEITTGTASTLRAITARRLKFATDAVLSAVSSLYVSLTGNQTIAGVKTYNDKIVVGVGTDTGGANDARIELKSYNGPMAQTKKTILVPNTGLTSDISVNFPEATCTLATTTLTETLTNKTLTSPVINTPTGIVKGNVGLGNVDNTSDTNKPVSTAQQTALNLKANIASPTFTGTVTAPALNTTGVTSLGGALNKRVTLRTSTATTASTDSMITFSGSTASQVETLTAGVALANNSGRVITYKNNATVDWILRQSASNTLDGGSADITLKTGESISVLNTALNTWVSFNKVVVGKKVVATTQSATPSINVNNGDIFQITGLAQAITSMSTNLTGTPIQGQMIMVQITDNGTARAITWGASFVSGTSATLPTTTVISVMKVVLLQYTGSTWKCLAVD